MFLRKSGRLRSGDFMDKVNFIEESLASLSAALASGASFRDVIFSAYISKVSEDNRLCKSVNKSYQFTSMSAEIIANWLRWRCESCDIYKNINKNSDTNIVVDGNKNNNERKRNNKVENDINKISQSLMSAYKLSNNLGCSMLDCVDAVASSYRYKRRAEALRNEVLAMPEATITLLTALPLLTLFAGELMGSSPLKLLFTTSRGFIMLSVGLVSYVIGVIWVKTMLDQSRKNMMCDED